MASELKERVAQNIRDAIAEMGFSINIFPGDFRVVSGFWRRVDVFRWQVYADLYDGSRWTRIEISSWDTLSACARKGMTIRAPGYLVASWEADAAEPQKAAA